MQPTTADGIWIAFYSTGSGGRTWQPHLPLASSALPAIYVIWSSHCRPTFLFIAQLLMLASQLFSFSLNAILFSSPFVFYVHSLSFQSFSFHALSFKTLPFNFQSLTSNLEPLPFFSFPDGLQVLLSLPTLTCAILTETKGYRFNTLANKRKLKVCVWGSIKN